MPSTNRKKIVIISLTALLVVGGFLFSDKIFKNNGTIDVNAAGCTATGGIVTEVNGYCVHTFTAGGTFTPGRTTNAEVLVVAGGGGGGGDGYGGSGAGNGGGGAGGLIYTTSYSITAATPISVTVGAGGAGGVGTGGYNVGSNGSNSVFGALTAVGGGGGGAGVTNGLAGGSGGGAGYNGAGGAATAGQGYAGATGNTGSIPFAAHGGGGAGGAGATAASSSVGGLGGVGKTYFGSTYATGGNGANGWTAGAGLAGTANTGNGGGGSGGAAGAAGGSGVVIIRYMPDISLTTTIDGIYTVNKYTGVGSMTWTPPAGITQVDYLVVAGGGGGGSDLGGGGGGGGVLPGSGYSVSSVPYTITVGAGGLGGQKVRLSDSLGSNGSNSSFGSFVAIGGGGGGAYWTSISTYDVGKNGGSGGGNGAKDSVVGTTVSSGTAGQGNSGGTAGYNGGYPGGGGGGAGGVGGNSGAQTTGGNGGIGLSSSITGTATYYGGGGGGSNYSGTNSNSSGGTGGLGGGGNGGYNVNTGGTSVGVSGAPNTGGGGGGGSWTGAAPSIGGNGGSGTVIIRYASSSPAAITQTTAVATPTSDSTPNYVFNSSKAGTIIYGGDCSSATTTATSGPNTVTFNTLSVGTHSNCTIAVATTSSAGDIAPLASSLTSSNWGPSTTVAGLTNGNTAAHEGSYTLSDAGGTIGLVFSSAKTINKIRFYSLATSELVKHFKIEKYNSGTWTKIPITGWADGATAYNTNEGQAQSVASGGWNTVTFAEVTDTQFRINFSDTWNIGDSNAAVSEIQMEGVLLSPSNTLSVPSFTITAAATEYTSTNLTCSVTTDACNQANEVIVFKLYSSLGNHAELSTQFNYSYKVCCRGTGISNSCSGSYDTVLKLSAATNAHAEKKTLSNYTNNVCLSATGMGVTCGYSVNTACSDLGPNYVCLASMSGDTGAHVGDCTAYSTKVCCKVAVLVDPCTAKVASNKFVSAKDTDIQLCSGADVSNASDPCYSVCWKGVGAPNVASSNWVCGVCHDSNNVPVACTAANSTFSWVLPTGYTSSDYTMMGATTLTSPNPIVKFTAQDATRKITLNTSNYGVSCSSSTTVQLIPKWKEITPFK